MNQVNKNNRRGFFKFVVASVGVAAFGTTQAFGKTTKDVAKYVEQPKNGDKCSNCLHFEKETSTCAIVKGKVVPKGWCTFYLATDAK
ncbi:MAG: high-potential iron-sulfur protein [Campylobacterota bacterium]